MDTPIISYYLPKRKILTGLFLFLYSWLFAQIQISTEHIAELNNNRLKYHLIDTILDQKKIVLLGELDHGDGTSFLVKTDLIKYLHEELGFNNLLFETSFINMDLLWETIQDSAGFHENIKKSMYNIWSEVEETNELFRYIKARYDQGTPLKIAGIDPQFSGRENTVAFASRLAKMLPSAFTTEERFTDFIHDLELLSVWMTFQDAKKYRLTEKEFHDYCDTIRQKIFESRPPNETLSRWNIFLENVQTLGTIKRKRDGRSFELRDKKMFDNVQYLLELNPDEKFIIWAANAHIIRNDSTLLNKGKKYYLLGLKKLGDYLSGFYRQSLYSIAITTSKGATLDFLQPTRTNKIKAPKKNSLEKYMLGQKTSFIDLQRFEKSCNLNLYNAQILYTNKAYLAKWSHHVDGVIYIPEIKPSTPLWNHD